MAFKNPFKLSKRKQGELIGQVFKLISLHSDFFTTRTRISLKQIAVELDAIYWLENPKQDITSLTIVDPKYDQDLDGLKWKIISHTISKIPNQIHNILEHIMGDYNDSNLILLSRDLLGSAMQLESSYGFVGIKPDELEIVWPSFASSITDYFNLPTKETFLTGCKRKGYTIFVKLADSELGNLATQNPKLYKFIEDGKLKLM
jgi:hypothetical protein